MLIVFPNFALDLFSFTCCLMNLAGQRLVLDLRRFNRERIAHTMGSILPHIDSQPVDPQFGLGVVQPPPLPIWERHQRSYLVSPG